MDGIAKDLKISRNSVMAIEQRVKAEGRSTPQRVERIKETFRDKATLIMDEALAAVSTRKLRASSAADCMKLAERAAGMAGLLERSSAKEGQLAVLAQFNLQINQLSVSAVDQEPQRHAADASRDHMLPNQADRPELEAAGGPDDGDGQLDGERPSEGSQRR